MIISSKKIVYFVKYRPLDTERNDVLLPLLYLIFKDTYQEIDDINLFVF